MGQKLPSTHNSMDNEGEKTIPQSSGKPSKTKFHRFVRKELQYEDCTVEIEESVEQQAEFVQEKVESVQQQADFARPAEPLETPEQNTSAGECMDEIEEIKIKWSSFIKMKQKNYLQDYSVINVIGKGGFGTVSKVKGKYTGLVRAAKKIKKEGLGKAEHTKLFEEMVIMIGLDHPNITRLYEVYDYNGSYVLVLELCEGGQLFDRISTQRITEMEAAYFTRQIVQALIYIHGVGIVHRDLKPENMLFEKGSDVLKIIDFGIAVRKKEGERLTSRIGTPYYIAPEVLLKDYDERCDMWSLGVIVYMIVGFRPPFNGESEREVMESILNKEPSFSGSNFARTSRHFKDFMKRILMKNPKDRFTAAQAISHPWLRSAETSLISPVPKEEQQKTQQELMSNLKTFKFDNRLQAVVYTFIVCQVLNSEEKQAIKKIFEDFDHNHDGVISATELQKALARTTSREKTAFLMKIIDTNRSSKIDFTEFVVAALDWEQLTTQRYEQAFSYFDIDHSGYITKNEIAVFLQNKTSSQEQIKKIFSQVDENGDGKISKQQFVKIFVQRNSERAQKRASQRRTTSSYPQQPQQLG